MAVEFCKFIQSYGSYPSHDTLKVPSLRGVVASVYISPSTLSNDFFGLTNVESCCAVCIIGNVFCCVIKLDIHKAVTLGVSASVCLMEVGRSIEVCHKLAYSLAETSLFWKRRATKEALLVHNRSSTSIWDCIPSSYFWNEAKLGVSSAWWPLYKGDNNGRALMVETAKSSRL